MPDLPAIGQLVRLEFRKIFKGKVFYIVLAVIVLLSFLIVNGQGDSYRRDVSNIQQNLSNDLIGIEQGILPAWSTYNSIAREFLEIPLCDETGALIPENIEYCVQYYTEYSQQRIDSLTEEGGMYSLNNLMGEGATQVAMFIPLLGVALAVGLFAGEFRGGYRLMISRGVRRSYLVMAKIITTLGLALGLAAVFTAVLLLVSIVETSGIDGTGLASVSASVLWGIFGISLLMLVSYMLLGGALGMILASSGSAMAIGLALAFVSATFFFNITPEDSLVFFADISPLTLGYNFNSLMYYVWRAGEEFSRYRDVIPSLAALAAYAVIFTGVIYGIFSRKQLRG